MAMEPLPVMNKVFSLVLQFETEFVNTSKENGNGMVQEMASFVGNQNNNQFEGIGTVK